MKGESNQALAEARQIVANIQDNKEKLIETLKRKDPETGKSPIDLLADNLFDPRPPLCSFVFVETLNELENKKISEHQIAIYVDYEAISFKARLSSGEVKSCPIDYYAADTTPDGRIISIMTEQNASQLKYILEYAIEKQLLDYFELESISKGEKRSEPVSVASKVTSSTQAPKEICTMNAKELNTLWTAHQVKDFNPVRVNNRSGVCLLTIDQATSLNTALENLKGAFEIYQSALNFTGEEKTRVLESARTNLADSRRIMELLSVKKLNEIVNPPTHTTLSSTFNSAKSKNPKNFDLTTAEKFIESLGAAFAQTSGEINNDLKLAKKALKTLDLVNKIDEIFEKANPTVLQEMSAKLNPKTKVPHKASAGLLAGISSLKKAVEETLKSEADNILPRPPMAMARLLAGGISKLRETNQASQEGEEVKGAVVPSAPPAVLKMAGGGGSFLDQINAKSTAKAEVKQKAPERENIAKTLLEQLESKQQNSHVGEVTSERKESAETVRKPRRG